MINCKISELNEKLGKVKYAINSAKHSIARLSKLDKNAVNKYGLTNGKNLLKTQLKLLDLESEQKRLEKLIEKLSPEKMEKSNETLSKMQKYNQALSKIEKQNQTLSKIVSEKSIPQIKSYRIIPTPQKAKELKEKLSTIKPAEIKIKINNLDKLAESLKEKVKPINKASEAIKNYDKKKITEAHNKIITFLNKIKNLLNYYPGDANYYLKFSNEISKIGNDLDKYDKEFISNPTKKNYEKIEMKIKEINKYLSETKI
jgi:hypothetical protein